LKRCESNSAWPDRRADDLLLDRDLQSLRVSRDCHKDRYGPERLPLSLQTECCKILRAVSTTPAKILAPAIVDLIHVDLPLVKFAPFAPPKISFTPLTLDTGPPGRTSFVELIGSIRAHAPPSLA